MPRVKTVVVEGAVNGTFHDGSNMIVLRDGKDATVSEASLQFLRDKRLIREEGAEKDSATTPRARRSAGAPKRAPKAKTPADPELSAARKAYRSAVGKNAGPSWDAATVNTKLAEFNAQAAGSDDEQAPAA